MENDLTSNQNHRKPSTTKKLPATKNHRKNSKMSGEKPQTPPPTSSTHLSSLRTPSSPLPTPTSSPYNPSSVQANPSPPYPSPPYTSRSVTPTTEYHENQRGSAPIPVYPDSHAHSPGDDQHPLERVPTHGSSQYLTAIPIDTLSRLPAPVDCPMCKRRAMTNTVNETGNFTHMWAAIACFTMCLGCIPYCIGNVKDVRHSCGNCGKPLALWHRSGGGTDVLAHPLK